ncbi:hypothetical protein Bca4012_063698 [Brassica carinata]
MSSRSRSSKRHSPSHSSLGDSPANDVVTPKHELEVEEDAREAYYRALCGSLPPLQDIPIPRRPLRPPGAPFTPSMVSPEYLTILRNFYQVPSGVTFRIPTGDESARNPPQGFLLGFMDECAHAESLVPPIEGRVRKLWDPIKVSEDTVETGAGGNAEGADEEVDQPTSLFGISMSGYLDLDY